MAARLKNGAAQGFRLANSERIFFNLSRYDYYIVAGADKFLTSTLLKAPDPWATRRYNFFIKNIKRRYFLL